MATANAQTTAPITEAVPLALIRRWDRNPRQSFEKDKLEELTASIRQDGVLEPILLRPAAADRAGTRFEIVAGERRWRAAGRAGLAAIPAIVRAVPDAKALELALAENVQREALNPVEEAEGFERLMKEHKYSVDDIALKMGKSRSFVWQRLKLAALPAAARKALLEERIPASVAVLIARIPHARLQDEATKVILAGHGRGEPLSFRESAQYVHETYFLTLAGAPFDPADAQLVPGAGPCATCPKRTGANPDLFGDVQRGDTCTDPVCFKAKADAAWKRTQGEAAKEGQAVLADAQAKSLFGHGGRLAHGSPYVDLAARCDEDPRGRHWQRLFGKHVPRVVVARDDGGRVHRLVKRTDAADALKKAGHRFRVEGPERHREPSAAARAAEQKRRKAVEVLRRTTAEATAALVAKVEAQEPGVAWWRLVVAAFADGSWHDAINTVMKRRGWAAKGNRPEESLRAQVERLGAPQLRGLLTELVVNRFGVGGSWQAPALGKQLARACDLYRIDLRKLQAKVRDDVAAQAAAKAARKGGKPKENARK